MPCADCSNDSRIIVDDTISYLKKIESEHYWWMRRIHILFGCLVLIVFQDVEKWIFYYNKTMNRMEKKYAGVAEVTKITVNTLNIKKYCQMCHTITLDHVWF